MKEIQNKKAFICDMDGVIYHGSKILDGVKEFVNWLLEGPRRAICSKQQLSADEKVTR